MAITPRSALANQSSLELFHLLLSTDANDSFIKDILSRRMIGGETVVFKNGNGHATTSNGRQLTGNVARRYQHILDKGWQAESMKDPGNVLRQMKISITTNDSLERIGDFEPALNFIKAMERHYAAWLVDNNIDDDYPDGPLEV